MTHVSAKTAPLAHTIKGSGPGLLLSHGGGGSIEGNYGALLPGLAEHFTVVGPDYPGSGGTPRSEEPLTLDGLADALVATADAAGLETFSLVGYSMGTSVAIRATTRHPGRVTSLALVAGFAKPDPYLRVCLDLWHSLLDGDRCVLAEFLVLMGLGEQVVSALSPGEVEGLLDEVGRTVPAGTIDHVTLAKTIDVRADLPRIAVPTLVVKTTFDRLATPAHSDELAAGIPGARMVELDCGHSVALERAEQLLSHLLAHFGH